MRHGNASLAESLASLPELERTALLQSLTESEAQALEYDWKFWARLAQLPPSGDWRVWMVLAGRGFGKTRTGAEWVRAQAESGQAGRIALVAPTAADARDVMVEGESGILRISPPWNRPHYEPSKRRITWPNGAMATTYSADEPDRLRGPQHDSAWCDELASWQYPEAWDMLLLGLRLGRDPRVVVTTTPKPVKHVKDLVSDPTCVVTRGNTYENIANLAPAFIAQVIKRYEGTRLGRQELEAQILEDVEGALWSHTMIEALRVTYTPDLVRVVVGVDPEATSDEGSAETGIVAAGLGIDGHGYVLADLSVRGSPDTWARAVVNGYHAHNGDRIIAEANNGGDMVAHTIRTIDAKVPIRLVHASKGKITRAEPVAALYEQGKVHHVGLFAALEDQQCTYVPGAKSPDRMDALVWTLTDLMLDRRPQIDGLELDLSFGSRESPWKV